MGRVPEGERLSSEELWRSHVKAWTAELAADAPPTKSAEMCTIAMLLALELVIGDESQQMFFQGFGMGYIGYDMGLHEMR